MLTNEQDGLIADLRASAASSVNCQKEPIRDGPNRPLANIVIPAPRPIRPDGLDGPCSTGVAMRHNAVAIDCWERSHPIQVTTIGIDLAKNIFQVRGIISGGTVAFNKSLRRAQLLQFFKNFEPCTIGMEACGSGHHWARQFQNLGHEFRLMPAMYVKANVRREKSGTIDAEAICEAVTRPTVRFVAIKTEE